MSASKTSLTLLASLRDPSDEIAWQRFDDLYRLMLFQFARKLGLDPHDADDAAQKSIIVFRESYTAGNYDRSKGRLKNWLLGIAKHQIADLHDERARQPMSASQRSTFQTVLDHLRDPDSLSAVWDQQWRTHLLRQCFALAEQQFSSRDVRIFRMLTTEQRTVDDVAQQANMSAAAVRVVKHRVLTFMRQTEAQIEALA